MASLWSRFDDATPAPGFGDRAVLALSVAVVLAAWILQPSDTDVTLFGWPVPVTCGFRSLTGWPCPGCGLTRSFTWMAHGHPLDAFRHHLLGPPGFLLTVAQIPFRIVRLWRRRRA